jgi:hypothetical protein
MMQAKVGLNNDQALFGGRAMITTTPYQPISICTLITKKERTNGMAHFGDIAKAFNSHALGLSKRGKIKNINGLYLRTLMVFMAYANLPVKECNAQNAKSYMLNKLNFEASSATISRNTGALRELGLLTLVEDPLDARVKNIELTTLGKEFAKLMR